MNRGWDGLTRYRKQRSDWHKGIKGFKDPGCFHDGDSIIQPVKDQHTWFKDSKRECDHVTRPILNYVDNMLQNEHIRPTASMVSHNLREIMNKQLEKQHRTSTRVTYSSRHPPSTPPDRRLGHKATDSFSPNDKFYFPDQVTDRPTSGSPTSISPSEVSERTDTTEDQSESHTVYEAPLHERRNSIPSRPRVNTAQSVRDSSIPRNHGLDYPQSPSRTRSKAAVYPEPSTRPLDYSHGSANQPGSVMPPQTRPVEAPPPIPATVTIPKNNRPKVTHLSFQEAKRWVDTKKSRSGIPLPGEELLARLGSRDVVSVDRESRVGRGTYTVPDLPD